MSKDGDGFFTGVITATSYSGIDLSDVTGATGDFSIADKIVHTGDTNTALRFPAADTVTAETGGSERIRIDSSGRALLGPGAVATPKASTSGLDVSSGLYSIIMGGETNVGTGDGRRDGYQKESRLGMPHFTVAEEPVGLIYGVTLSGENRLYFGGGSSILNAATSISFHTAPSATTTAGTERLKVEAAGNVNFANNVNVSGTSTVSGIAQFANTINLTHASAGQNYIYFNEDIQLAKNGTGTRLKIDSDGRVLIGQTSSVNGIYGSPPPRFSVSTTTASPAIFATYSNDVYGSRIDLIKSRATTVGGTTVVQAGDAIGEIIFGGADGDQFHPTALIQSVVEAGVGNNDMPGDLRFYTNGGTTTATERARIDSAGNFKFNSGYGSVKDAYGVRAWANYDHVDATVRGSAQLTSVTDTSTGRGTFNWAFTFVDQYYAAVGTAGGGGGNYGDDNSVTWASADHGTTTLTFRTDNFKTNANHDSDNLNVVIVR